VDTNYTAVRFDYIQWLARKYKKHLVVAARPSPNFYDPFFIVYVNDPVLGVSYYNYEYITASEVTARPLSMATLSTLTVEKQMESRTRR